MSARASADQKKREKPVRLTITKAVTPIAPSLLCALAFVAYAPAAQAQITVGGHVGFVVPWVTEAGGRTTTEFDGYNIGFPLGITFKGPGRFAIDLETIPFVNSARTDPFVVDPGVLYTVNPGSAIPVTLGLRAAFTTNAAQVGFIPLVHLDNPLGAASFIQESGFLQSYFVEFDLPVQFSRPRGGPATDSVTFATHFGLGF